LGNKFFDVSHCFLEIVVKFVVFGLFAKNSFADFILLTEYSVSKKCYNHGMTNDTNKSISKKRVRRDRREEILQTASNLFSIHGFRGTSLASIAEAVDLTEPGLLHYFPSKINLLQSVLEYRDQQDEKKYTALVQPGKSQLIEGFQALEDLVAENEERPGLVRLFTVLVGESIRKDHPSHDYFVKRYGRIREAFKAYFVDLVEVEEIPADIDIDQLSSLIFAVMDGLQIQWLLDSDEVSMSETFRLFSKILAMYLISDPTF
jgi:AcrR family transcriptional regulator